MNGSRFAGSGWKGDLFPYLPTHVTELLLGVEDAMPLEELRLRANGPVQLYFRGHDRLLYLKNGDPPMDEGDCESLLARFCGQSVYAFEEELRGGFLTLPGGYRVGLCGEGVLAGGRLARFSRVTGFNIRIARQVKGAAATLIPRIMDRWGRLCSTLILSPPGCGKTTLLRDLARCASAGEGGVRPCRVGVVDARYELAGTAGAGGLDLGPRTDVLSGVPRAEGMRLLVTNMAPDLLVTDELATVEDGEAALYGAACGARVIASAHAGICQALLRRPGMGQLLESGLFQRIAVLGRSRGPGTVEQVLDGEFRRIEGKEEPCCVGLP